MFDLNLMIKNFINLHTENIFDLQMTLQFITRKKTRIITSSLSLWLEYKFLWIIHGHFHRFVTLWTLSMIR